MSRVTVRTSELLGVPVVTFWFSDTDPRGLFAVPYSAGELAAAGLRLPPLVQTNLSVSDRAGTVRGVHVGTTLKYVTAVGRFTNVVVCLDPQSPHYGQHEAMALRPGTAVVVPAGWGNALVNATDAAVYLYWMDGPYATGSERVISPTDPDLGVDWTAHGGDLSRLSAKDAAGVSFSDYLLDPVPLPGGPTDPRALFA